ncbi:hypothetical protein DKG34_05610 [Streptomyces sp. NWU49]|uniref:ATP-binding protein n=1 Tax=Streptomyces sp. NWU49 TaxID=2201153 RepID=UPI000D6768C3|nr:hypothetical protein [Streptomyces sp. NWU49]PWJ08000.1 hypothetical protein DKG34_05610 [Streptomyces sp. NWU49]
MSAVSAALALLLTLMITIGGSAAWVLRRRWQRARQEAERLARQQRATEHALVHLVQQMLPQLRHVGRPGALPPLPAELAGTTVGKQLTAIAVRAAEVVHAVAQDIQSAARGQIEQAQTAAAEEISQIRTAVAQETAQVHSAAVESTRTAVRSVSSALVGMAAKTGRQVSEGVRRHEGDAAFETLTGIDHTVQQMLLTAQGWAVLAGGKLTRRWPATALTDVVRAAMGYIEDYQRVRTQELPTAVTSRAVGPIVHTLALLLDNAVRYSPPNATVHVSFQEGHHGVTVLVDDAGLRMTPEQLDRARDILTGHRSEDLTQLGAYPQTGFRVAAALAGAYGFRVDLEAPNAFLGTRALVFLPQDLLTTVPQAQPTAPAPLGTTTAASLAPVRPSLQPGRTPALPQTTASGLTVRARGKAPSAGPAPRLPAAEPGRPSVVAAWARGTQRARSGETPSSPAPEEGPHS